MPAAFSKTPADSFETAAAKATRKRLIARLKGRAQSGE
jgi:hypothetical protein